jgi:hypothetical protein
MKDLTKITNKNKATINCQSPKF